MSPTRPEAKGQAGGLGCQASLPELHKRCLPDLPVPNAENSGQIERYTAAKPKAPTSLLVIWALSPQAPGFRPGLAHSHLAAPDQGHSLSATNRTTTSTHPPGSRRTHRRMLHHQYPRSGPETDDKQQVTVPHRGAAGRHQGHRGGQDKLMAPKQDKQSVQGDILRSDSYSPYLGDLQRKEKTITRPPQEDQPVAATYLAFLSSCSSRALSLLSLSRSSRA